MSEADQDRLDRLRLIRSSNIGPVTYFQLIQRFGTAKAALDAIPHLAARGGGKAPTLARIEDISREVEAVQRLGARYLFLGQGLYPPLLAEIDTAPPALIVRGDLRLLDRPTVALVRAMRLRRHVASHELWRLIWRVKALLSFPAWHAELILPRIKERLQRGQLGL
jgi:DNA processing protein